MFNVLQIWAKQAENMDQNKPSMGKQNLIWHKTIQAKFNFV